MNDVKKTNSEKIREFMKFVCNSSWSDFAKVIFICKNICEMYMFNSEYFRLESRKSIIKREDKIAEDLIRNHSSGTLDDFLSSETVFIEESKKVCKTLVALALILCRYAGIDNVFEIHPVVNDPHVNLVYKFSDDKFAMINMTTLLYLIQTKSDYTNSIYGISNEEIYCTIAEFDKSPIFAGSDLSHAREIRDSYIGSRLGCINAIFSERGKYLQKVTGKKLQGQSIVNYYNYVLRSLFPSPEEDISFIVDCWYGKSKVIYIVNLKIKDNRYIFIYDNDEGKFRFPSQREIEEYINNANKSEEERLGICENHRRILKIMLEDFKNISAELRVLE